MKLAEALTIIAKAPMDAKPMPVFLACGFTPLHLANYLAAFLQQAFPERKIRVETGLFGDLQGSVANFVEAGSGIGVLVVEWSDLDPRLGFRQTGGWGQRAVPSILETVHARLKHLGESVSSLSSSARLIVSLPTLDLPPAFHTSSWQASEAETALSHLLAGFSSKVVSHPSVSLLNGQWLASRSPSASRYDFRSDLNTGFPYTQSHAEAMGNALARLVKTSEPKKGLITDLDDTFWRGLVGEIGADSVTWDLASHAQMHGLYQQSIKALAEQGVLVAIASKNSPDVVSQALARKDLIMDSSKMFPIEVHWQAKSESVGRILKAWNISADAVVFVDDSPMELAEVRNAHPGIEVLQFPTSDYAAGFALLQQLRDLFGRPRLSEEDSYRLESIRQGQQFAAVASGKDASNLLASVEAVITLEFTRDSTDKRSLELVNKTNQFNLNGKRYTDEEWHEAAQTDGAIIVNVSYEDKFGPLGKIAVLRGQQQAGSLVVDAWVMSCRAFSRQIEYQVLAQLFETLDVDQLEFSYVETSKNGPLANFLSDLLEGHLGTAASLKREHFKERCPTLHHMVRIKQ